MKNYGIRFFSLLLILSFLPAAVSLAQATNRPRNDEITNILSRFKNYRFGAVNIYEIMNTDELKEALKALRQSSQPGQQKEGASTGEECANRIEEEVQHRNERQIQV
jgi:electron transfer flavoprotein alpha/beta subunit